MLEDNENWDNESSSGSDDIGYRSKKKWYPDDCYSNDDSSNEDSSSSDTDLIDLNSFYYSNKRKRFTPEFTQNKRRKLSSGNFIQNSFPDYERGVGLFNAGNFEEALIAFEKAVSQSAGCPYAWEYKAKTHVLLEQKGEAAQCFLKAFEILEKHENDYTHLMIIVFEQFLSAAKDYLKECLDKLNTKTSEIKLKDYDIIAKIHSLYVSPQIYLQYKPQIRLLKNSSANIKNLYSAQIASHETIENTHKTILEIQSHTTGKLTEVNLRVEELDKKFDEKFDNVTGQIISLEEKQKENQIEIRNTKQTYDNRGINPHLLDVTYETKRKQTTIPFFARALKSGRDFFYQEQSKIQIADGKNASAHGIGILYSAGTDPNGKHIRKFGFLPITKSIMRKQLMGKKESSSYCKNTENMNNDILSKIKAGREIINKENNNFSSSVSFFPSTQRIGQTNVFDDLKHAHSEQFFYQTLDRIIISSFLDEFQAKHPDFVKGAKIYAITFDMFQNFTSCSSCKSTEISAQNPDETDKTIFFNKLVDFLRDNDYVFPKGTTRPYATTRVQARLLYTKDLPYEHKNSEIKNIKALKNMAIFEIVKDEENEFPTVYHSGSSPYKFNTN